MPISRRRILKQGAAAATAAGALWNGEQAAAQSAGGPAVVAGRRFKAWVSRGEGTRRTTLQEVTLRPISGRQVVVRTEATNLCYSNVPPVLGIQAPAAAHCRSSGRCAGR